MSGGGDGWPVVCQGIDGIQLTAIIIIVVEITVIKHRV